MKKLTIVSSQMIVLGLSFFLLCAFIGRTQVPWVVPAEYKAMKNPVPKNDKTLAEGKELYAKHCLSCHGEKGKGDGPKVKQLIANPANLSINKVASQTDGEHFYKIKIGRDGLHSYKSKLDDEGIWTVINYMHTFESK
jgi:mono/diheme cytochrome c family protein